MWLFLVAAGSGYLANCWQKTLRAKPQLTEFAHEDPQVEEERASTSSPQPPDGAWQNASQRNSPSPLELEPEPKPAKRNFSPKALSKRLFPDGGKGWKTAAKKVEANASSADETGRLIGDACEKSPDAAVGHSKRSPWSSFRSKSKEGFPGETSRESSGCLKRTGDAFRKSRERLRSSDSGSLSSRSMQALFGEAGDGSSFLGSSRREVAAAADAVETSPELPVRSLSGAFAAEADEPTDFSRSSTAERSGSLPSAVAESELKPTLSGPSERSSRKDESQSPADSSSVSRDVASTVAEVVARIERGNLLVKAEKANGIRGLRAANQAQERTPLKDRQELRTLNVDRVEQISVEEAEFVAAGKGKRRADAAGKVAGDGEGRALPAVLSGRRTIDTKHPSHPLSRDSSGVTMTSVTAKRMKDAAKSDDDKGSAGEPVNAWAFGAVNLSQVFFGFESSFLESAKEEKSPFRISRRTGYLSRSGTRGTMRRMRESPKPVSALESCLRAQLPFKDEGSRVVRSLNFSSLAIPGGRSRERDEPGVYGGDSCSPSSGCGSEQRGLEIEGALGLPLLATSPSKASVRRGARQSDYRGQQMADASSSYPRKVVVEDKGSSFSSQSKLNDVVWRSTTLPVTLKKRKVSQACSPSATLASEGDKGYELEALVLPPMEGLLFSFGVGVGVMSLISGPDSEVEKLSKQLHESEERIESLKNLLRQAKDFSLNGNGKLSNQVVGGGLSTEGMTREDSVRNEGQLDLQALSPAVDETQMEMVELFRREAPETPQQIEHMAELEAELEAELDALTGGIPEGTSAAPDFEELDPEGVAGVADRDLGVEGLPALLDWDDDNDDFITEEPAFSGGGVAPRELARLLRKVQSSWQENRIVELEAELHETVQKLEMMERELQLLKQQSPTSPPPPAGLEAEGLDTVADPAPAEDRLSIENSPVSAQMAQQHEFEGHESHDDERHDVSRESDIMSDIMDQPGSLSDEPTPSLPGSMSSLMLSEDSMDGNAQAANDAVCDEFLNSVFGSPEIDTREDSQIEASALISTEEDVSDVEQMIFAVSSEMKYEHLPNPAGEDLDQVVGELLLKRDNSIVKNALNAFLLWEAETDDMPSKDEVGEEELSHGCLRRAAGKNPTPQKTSLSSPSPPKTSVISARLEPLARSTHSIENMALLDKLGDISKGPGLNSDEKNLQLVEVSQSLVPKSEDKSVKLFGLQQHPKPKKDQGSQTSRTVGKVETFMTDNLKSEPPVFGGDKDFKALLDMRRELRYSSSRVQLSHSGPPHDRDSLPVYRHREDASRAGTNSPTGKVSSRSLFQSPKLRNSRLSSENRLYQNPTSDWLAEVGSPPDMQS